MKKCLTALVLFACVAGAAQANETDTAIKRDPFVNQITGSRVLPTQPHKIVSPLQQDSGREQVSRPGDRIPDENPTEVAIDPNVTVTGIVTSPAGRQAILTTEVGGRLVSQGEKLGDFQVTEIGENYVALSYQGAKAVKLSLKS